MALVTNSNRPYYRNSKNTKWIRAPEQKRPPRTREQGIWEILGPMLEGESTQDRNLAILFALRNFIRTPDRYTPHHRAVNVLGNITETTAPDALRWNIFGALEHITHSFLDRKGRHAIIQLVKKGLPQEAQSMGLWKWEEANGHHHSRVIHVLNMAISEQKKTLVV